MPARIISTTEKKSGQGCRTGFEGGVLKDPDLVEGSYNQRKEFFAFWRSLFCGTPKLWGPWNSLFPFILALLGRLNKLITSWNDRRLRRVFVFLLGHFETNECEVSNFCS